MDDDVLVGGKGAEARLRGREGSTHIVGICLRIA